MTKEEFIEKTQGKILITQSKIDKLNVELARLKNILANPDPHLKASLREKNKYQKKKTKSSSAQSVPHGTPEAPKKSKSWLDDII